MNAEVENKLKQITIEDNIWIIYLGIIVLSWYSNYLEKNYFIYHDANNKEKYRKIMILIFSILVLVYLYFFNSSYSDLCNLKETDSKKKKELTYLSFIGSLLIVISGFIFLYIALKDDELNVEIAFN